MAPSTSDPHHHPLMSANLAQLSRDFQMASLWYQSWQNWQQFWINRFGQAMPPAPPPPAAAFKAAATAATETSAASAVPPPAKLRLIADGIKTEKVAAGSAPSSASGSSAEDTLGMLLRNGKQSKQIFKPYDGHDERVKSGRMIRRKVRAGCKRKLQDLSSTEGLSEYDLSLVDKSISSEFEFEDEEEEEVEIIEEQKTTTIGNLFPEILTEIFEKLDVQSRGRAAQVCRTWRDACYRKSCWRSVQAKLHIGKSNPAMYQSLAKRGIGNIQVLSLKRTVREMMTNVPKLEKLNLSGCYNFTDSVVEGCFARREFPNLKVLDLSLCKEVRDSSLALMAKKCPNIEELDLAGCSGVTNQGLREVAASLKKLRKLNLRSCRQITDAGISHLASHSSTLEDLSLQDCQKLTDESLNILSKAELRLASLNLSFCVSVTDTGLKSLSRVGSLRSLNLRSCDNVSDIGVSFLAERVSSLTDLDVSFCANVTNASMCHVASGFPALRSLSMTTCSVNDLGLKRLASSEAGKVTLERLNIGQCVAVTDQGLKSLSDVKKMRFLDLYGCPKVSKKAVDDLMAKVPSLEKVNQQL